VIPGSAFDVSSITLRFDYIKRENNRIFRRDGLKISMTGKGYC
jgi:hypothetical protein